VVGWLRFKDVTMIILLRKEEREHERECTIRLDQPAFYTILKKAGKGEGKCPGVYPQRGYSTSIHNVGGTTRICVVDPQHVDTMRRILNE
jgi:hypothetical protein